MKFFRDVFKTRDITDSKEMDLTAYNISVIMVRIFIKKLLKFNNHSP